VNIRHDDRPLLCSSRTADAAPQGDTDARRLAVERSEHKLMTIKEIESDPIATIEVTIMGTDSSQIRDCEHLRSIEAMTTPVISAG
jgi:hypothetical protein